MTTPTPADDQTERRDRYKAAIRENDGWVLDDGQHMLDAVMAVADAEQAELRRKLTTAERLRVEQPAAVPAVDRAALRDRIAEALMQWAERNNSSQYASMRRPETVKANAYSRADAVLAVLSEPTSDRVRAVCDQLHRAAALADGQPHTDRERGIVHAVTRIRSALDDPAELRRLADETPDTEAPTDPSWPRRAWDLGLLHKGGDPHHCPACLKQPEPPKDFICPGAEANAAVLANPQPAAGAQPTAEADRIVAYRSPGGHYLHCIRHADELGLSWTPLTSNDLPDGGLCTYPRCGADVLIHQPAAGARQDGATP